MLVAVSSINGSPGVSAWTLLLAAAWPGTQTRILVEADSAGGVLAARYGLSSDPGVISLVSQARLHPGQRLDIQSCGRRLDDNVWCVPGPETAEGASHIWSSGAGPLAECLEADERLWFVDCGRIYPNTTLSPLLAVCDIHIVFTESSTEALVAVPSRVNWLSEHSPTGVVSVGSSGRHVHELLDFFGAEQVWQLDHYSELAKTAGQIFESGRARRSKAWRSAVNTSDAIAAWLASRPRTADDAQLSPAATSEVSVPPAFVLEEVTGKPKSPMNSEADSVPPPLVNRSETGRPEPKTPTAPRVSGPKMPGDKFRASQAPPPPAVAKSGWYEPSPGAPGYDPPPAIQPSEAG